MELMTLASAPYLRLFYAVSAPFLHLFYVAFFSILFETHRFAVARQYAFSAPYLRRIYTIAAFLQGVTEQRISQKKRTTYPYGTGMTLSASLAHVFIHFIHPFTHSLSIVISPPETNFRSFPMLDLSDFSSEDRFSGRSPALPPMSTQQAKQEAQDLLSNGLPPSIEKAMNLLSVGGVMTAVQMGISPRTLRQYRHLRVVDRLPFNAPTIVNLSLEYGLLIPETHEQLLLFTLGPVGVEISKMRFETDPPSGYMGYTLSRLMHDVILNEIILMIARQAIAHGWAPVWVSEGEATVYRDQVQLLKPDAMLRLKKDGEEFLFLVEYHNEDKSTRAKEKVRRYERSRSGSEWKSTWETDTFPTVLAAFKESIVGRGYQEAINEQETGKCTFYGRVLSAILEDSGQWFNFVTGQKEHVWPWPENGNGAISNPKITTTGK
jgi:hypothetical protein